MTFRFNRNLQITSFAKIPQRVSLSIFYIFLQYELGVRRAWG